MIHLPSIESFSHEDLCRAYSWLLSITDHANDIINGDDAAALPLMVLIEAAIIKNLTNNTEGKTPMSTNEKLNTCSDCGTRIPVSCTCPGDLCLLCFGAREDATDGDVSFLTNCPRCLVCVEHDEVEPCDGLCDWCDNVATIWDEYHYCESCHENEEAE